MTDESTPLDHSIKEFDLAWIEKHRPNTFDEIVGQDAIVVQFRRYTQSRDLPNLLLAGPPGTGKSSVVICLAKAIHDEQWRNHTLRIDAPLNRGPDAIRERIRPFIRTYSTRDTPRFVIIEQAEFLSKPAQHALRPVIERNKTNVSVLLLCNQTSSIISPVQSLCALYRFSPVDDDPIRKRLTEIIETQDLEVTNKAINSIVDIADGDVRLAINTLQAVAVADEPIDESTVTQLVSSKRPEGVHEMLAAAIDGEYTEAQSKLDTLLKQGIAGGDLLSEAHDVAHEFDLSDDTTLDLINQIGDVKYRLEEGGDARIQIGSLLAEIAQH